jgi:hypothetical protein
MSIRIDYGLNLPRQFDQGTVPQLCRERTVLRTLASGPKSNLCTRPQRQEVAELARTRQIH